MCHVLTVFLRTSAVIPVILIEGNRARETLNIEGLILHPKLPEMAQLTTSLLGPHLSIPWVSPCHIHRRKELYLHSIRKQGLGGRAIANLIISEVVLLRGHFSCVLFFFCINVDTM